LKAWEKIADAALGVAASAILFVLMVITFADVVSRYVLNAPWRGSFEITELMLLVLIFAGLPLVSHADEHVTMDFIDKWLRARPLAVLERLVNALCCAAMLFLAWQVWLKAGKIAAAGDYTDTLHVVYGPFVYFMAVMTAVTGLVHLYRIFVPSARKNLQGSA
jgi:TRAP-type C4-dicarboxylate transport system permease small subunit